MILEFSDSEAAMSPFSSDHQIEQEKKKIRDGASVQAVTSEDGNLPAGVWTPVPTLGTKVCDYV